MPLTDTQIQGLAFAYDWDLASAAFSRRLAHHLGHVAPEAWLAMELAYLVNERGGDLGLHGWTAQLQKQRIDVQLCPPPSTEGTGEPTNLELKLIVTDNWNPLWRQVAMDLVGKPLGAPPKPPAHAAVCFLIDVLSDGAGPQARANRAAYTATVPEMPSTFQPTTQAPHVPLRLIASGPTRKLCWPHPVPRKNMTGYKANFRIVWVGKDSE